MPNKTLELEGFGRVVLNPVNIKERQYEYCDNEGNELIKVSGSRTSTIYKRGDTEIPSNQLCKKFNLDGEDLVLPKLKITQEIPKDEIEVVDDNSMIYTAIDRKIYNVFTDSEKLKDLILKQNKSLKLKMMVFGLGWKAYEGILTRWKDRLVLFGCIGDINKALEVYKDETVEFEIDMVPKIDKEKLLKATVRY